MAVFAVIIAQIISGLAQRMMVVYADFHLRLRCLYDVSITINKKKVKRGKKKTESAIPKRALLTHAHE